MIEGINTSPNLLENTALRSRSKVVDAKGTPIEEGIKDTLM